MVSVVNSSVGFMMPVVFPNYTVKIKRNSIYLNNSSLRW